MEMSISGDNSHPEVTVMKGQNNVLVYLFLAVDKLRRIVSWNSYIGSLMDT